MSDRCQQCGFFDCECWFQTWQQVGHLTNFRRRKRLTAIITRVCGWLTGHPPSKTEHGYGGGEYMDGWCRWCGKLLRLPLSAMPDRLRDLWDERP